MQTFTNLADLRRHCESERVGRITYITWDKDTITVSDNRRGATAWLFVGTDGKVRAERLTRPEAQN